MKNFKAMIRPVLLFAMAVAPLCTQPLQAATPPADPGIGSYFYFAALNPHCGASRSRSAALSRYKGQFLAMMGKVSASSPADLQQRRQYIDSLERREPNGAELAPFNAMFAKTSAGDIAQLCSNFESAIGQRMQVNELIMNPPQVASAKGKDSQAAPPIRYYSLQHLHAVMVSCEQADPVPANKAARAAAFARAIPRVRTPNGQYRTEVGLDGKTRQTEFPSAAVMVKSPEFEVDAKRYLAVVARSSQTALKNECAGFVTLMDGVGKK